jgi:hypothetical protein
VSVADGVSVGGGARADACVDDLCGTGNIPAPTAVADYEKLESISLNSVDSGEFFQ